MFQMQRLLYLTICRSVSALLNEKFGYSLEIHALRPVRNAIDPCLIRRVL